MSERVTMPALGESVTEGTVTRWLKSVGDQVAVDEPLLEVSTDKVDTEIPSPVAGILLEILVNEDDTVPVGSDLAVIGDASEGGASGSAPEPPQAAAEPSAPEQSAPAPAQAAPEQPATQAAPAAQEAPAAPAPAASGAVEGGTTVTMPALGESVTEGTVTRWLKAEGDQVEVDEPLLEVSTDKVDTEIPSPAAGTLTKILVGEDETVAVGADLAVIGGSVSGGGEQAPAQNEPEPQEPAAATEEATPSTEAEAPKGEPAAAAAPPAQAQAPVASPAPSAPAAPAPAAPAPSAAPAPAAPSAPAAGGGDASAYVTPLVRKLAAENGIDLASIAGTGIGGRIRKQDVLDAVEKAKAPAPAPEQPAAAPAAPAPAPAATATDSRRGTREKMTRLRKIIAARMVESLQVSAQLTTVVEVDMTKVARLRDRAKGDFEKREGTKLSFLPFIALATCEALKAHPGINASIDGDDVIYHGSENLAIAVDTPKGLIVPVLKNAGDLNIAGLARGIADIAARTRDNKITPDELSGGTFTITNTGCRGALFDTPILNQPQVAMLGTGAIVRRPVVIDADGAETIAIRSMMYLALTYDHRIVDGADAARFLSTVKERLEEGRFEASLGL